MDVFDYWRVKATKANPLGLPSTHDYPEDLRQFRGPATNNGFLFGYDYGSTSGARGVADLDADGHPVSYKAVSGDRWPQIAARFGLPQMDSFNCARRTSDQVYIGDVINLSPYTIASVGNENGSSKPANAETRKGCLGSTGIPKQAP